jgi:hypothetical protein
MSAFSSFREPTDEVVFNKEEIMDIVDNVRYYSKPVLDNFEQLDYALNKLKIKCCDPKLGIDYKDVREAIKKYDMACNVLNSIVNQLERVEEYAETFD